MEARGGTGGAAPIPSPRTATVCPWRKSRSLRRPSAQGGVDAGSQPPPSQLPLFHRCSMHSAFEKASTPADAGSDRTTARAARQLQRALLATAMTPQGGRRKTRGQELPLRQLREVETPGSGTGSTAAAGSRPERQKSLLRPAAVRQTLGLSVHLLSPPRGGGCDGATTVHG